MKKLFILTVIGVLLTSCGSSSAEGRVSEGGRFVNENGKPTSSVIIVKDTTTGCEYITKGTSYSGYTYLLGSCPDLEK